MEYIISNLQKYRGDHTPLPAQKMEKVGRGEDTSSGVRKDKKEKKKNRIDSRFQKRSSSWDSMEPAGRAYSQRWITAEPSAAGGVK